MSKSPEFLRWSLNDLLPGGLDELEKFLEDIEAKTQIIESTRPRLTEDLPVQEFLEILKAKEQLNEQAAIINAYAYLRYAENTQDSSALSLQDRIDQILTSVDNRLLFFSLWFKSLDEEDANRYITNSGELHYYLQSMRRFKPFTLSEPEEKIINLKDLNGSEGMVKLYEILTTGFKFQLEIQGEKRTLTRDGLNQYYRHPSPDIRAATFQELYRVYGQHRNILAQIYLYLTRDMQGEMVEVRGYKRPISARNLSNDLSDEVVDSLLGVCRQNSGLYQRYFKLKARILGMEKLRRYDIYAPIAPVEKSIGFHDASKLVMDSFYQFSPIIAEAASRVIKQDHLDSEVRQGKRGGAFSFSVTPKHTPWVMVNFTGRIRDVSTLAHELGHAVHTILAADHSVLNFHAAMPLAETASVFAEMLLSDRMLREETDPLVQRDLLISILDDSYATVQRQAFISIFEQEAFEQIAVGCTSEELADCYMNNLKDQFGDALEIPEEFAWEWITIPHIYQSPFYPYSYSFGQLLVLALYQQYLNDPEAFLPRYLKLLSYGGSAEPQVILSEAGHDITSPEFWQGGFNMLENRLNRLELIMRGIQ